ncbi:hypothetical protein [Enterococcus hirae]|uniref:hypothetical protein n=1 Tax=Enterococcus hirae TaxID=1354 RepID=UPI001378EDD4|nr:hypothetical protein [Enterococcus hirae]EHA3992799.1 hypothetical protein [Enterococcus faecalis]NBA54947.1 hypothetical protein [Enterococcus hirae]
MYGEINHSERREQPKETIATTFTYQRPAIQAALFVLWRIHNKAYQAGARLFYEEIHQHIHTTKGAYREALAFLEGASVVVNEVVVENKVPVVLIQRYGILENG